MTSKFNSQKSQEDNDNENGSGKKRLSAVSTASNNSSTTLDLDFDSVVSALIWRYNQVIKSLAAEIMTQ